MSMIGNEDLITKINTLIAGGSLSTLQLNQLSRAVLSIQEKGVASVANSYDLPPASANKGRFFFVESELRYVLSDGVTWDIDNILLKPFVNALAWGSNFIGQLGDGTNTTRSSPVIVTGGLTDWTVISAGRNHTAALRANGGAWAWGNNSNGQLGDGTVTGTSSPVSVIGGFVDWTDISAGGTHTAAVRANGSAWAWGRNNSGQLGDGTITSTSSPVIVTGGFTDWTAISAGRDHTVAVRANGTAWAWGFNNSRPLGDGTAIDRSSPVSVVGGFADWTAVSAGDFHTAGIRENGTAWAWGSNSSGQLGDGTLYIKSIPVSVVGGFTDWTAVSASQLHTAAVRANGSAWAWGSNSNGQLGDGTITNRSSPVSVVGGFTDWTDISAGGNLHTAAVRANGSAWAWGINVSGQLGDGTTTYRSSPVSVVGGIADWTSISARGDHTAATRTA